MVNHNHDIHYMLLVLILAFFVMALSMNQVPPSMTGNVVQSSSLGVNGFVVGFLKATTQPSKYRALSTDVIRPMNFETFTLEFRNANIAGNAVSLESSRESVCEWVNLKNEDLHSLKSMTGYSACSSMGYNACLMTNVETTTTFFDSSNGTCKSLAFRDNANNFGNCDARIKSISSACILDGHDFQENQQTTVFCCK